MSKTSGPRNNNAIPDPAPLIDWEEAIRLHQDEGLNAVQIARRLGFHDGSIRQGLTELGVYRKAARLGKVRLEHRHRLYQLWYRMQKRCRDPSDRQYPNFGGKGIDHCRQWDDFDRFFQWAQSSGYRKNLTLVLVNPSKDYAPANCHWVTTNTALSLMARHRDPPPALRPLTAFGETRPMRAWLRDPRCTVGSTGLWKRLEKGYPPQVAIGATEAELRKLPPPSGRRSAPGKLTRYPRTVDWDEAARLRREGWSYARIAKKLRSKESTIGRGLRKRNVEPPPREHRMKRPHWRLVYKKWIRIRNFCNNPEFKFYRYYGAKGIRVCREWDRFEPFYEWALANGFEPGKALTRRRKTGPFSPGNCAWATRSYTSRHANLNPAKREQVSIDW